MVRKVDIMVDLETLDSKAGAVITQIGAVHFNRDTGEVLHKFFANIDADSCVRKGMTIGADTVLWWLKQDKAAQNSLFNPKASEVSAVLKQFSAWVISCRQNFDSKCKLWCHASFDFPILNRAYELCDMQPVWHYRDYIDLRTIVEFSGIVVEKFGRDEDIAHNALSDCLFQVRYATAATKLFRAF